MKNFYEKFDRSREIGSLNRVLVEKKMEYDKIKFGAVFLSEKPF